MKLMKKLRIIAATLVFMLACQCFAPATFAAAPVNKAELTEECATFLMDIGAVEKAYSGVDYMSTLTRKDLASVLSALIQVNHVMPAPSSDPAGDVNLKNAELAKDVFIMTAYDVMPLDEKGNFRPDAYATFGDVKYAFASLLGYVNYAKATGLGEAELTKLIAKTDICKDVTFADDDYLTMADFLIIYRNVLDEEMIYQTLFSGTAVEFDKTTDVTMMEEYLNVVLYEGLVTANKYTSIFEPTGLDSDHILIEGYLCATGGTNAADYVGTRVNAYVQEDPETEKATVLKIDYATDANVLVIGAEDLMSEKSAFSLTNILYADEKGKMKSAKVSATANYFYNGRMCDLEKDDFDINNGTVTLISNNGGSTYDVVKIDAYENYMVTSIEEKDDEVLLRAKPDDVDDKEGKDIPKVLDLSETGENGIRYVDIRRANGRVVKPSQIKPNNIVSAYVSKDGGYVKAVLSTTVVEGEISGIDESGARSVFTINGADYKAFIFGTDWSHAGFYYKDMYPQFGSEGKFYIDASGYIAYAEYKSVTTQYGLLTGVTKSSAMSSDVKLQIVTSDGEIIEVPVLEKGVKINNYAGGASYTKPDDLYTLLRDNDQLIQYSLTEGGELRKLNIAQDISSVPNAVFDSYSNAEFSLDYSFTGTAQYSTTTRKFGSAANVQGAPGSNTKIFIIDRDSVSGSDIKPDGVSVVAMNSLRHDMKLENIKYYDLNETFEPAAMVAIEPEVDTSQLNADQKMYIADSTTRRLDAEGVEEIVVSLWDRGSLKSYVLAEGAKVDSFVKGDAVSVYRNFDNEIVAIKNIKKQLDGGEKGIRIYNGGGSDEFSCYGYVGKAYVLASSTEKMAYVYALKTSYASTDIKTLSLQSPVVYMVTKGDRDTEIKVSSLASIPNSESPDDSAMIYYFSNQGRVYDAVIYR